MDALDEELQHKYYQLIAENPPEEIKQPEPEVEKAAIDEFTEDERKEIDFWIDLTKRWQSYRKMPGVTSLAEVDKKVRNALQPGTSRAEHISRYALQKMECREG